MSSEYKRMSETFVRSVTAHSNAASAGTLDCQNLGIVRIVCPTTVGASVTSMTIQESWDDGTTFGALANTAGTSITYVPSGGKVLQVQPSDHPRGRQIKLIPNHADGDDTVYKIVLGQV